MSWSDIGKGILSALPLIGGLLGGPAGATVGTLAAHALGCDDTPDAVAAAIKADPDALTKLKQVEADHQVELRKLAITAEQNRLAADTAQVQTVNTTMQSESQSQHWLNASWRAIAGVLFAPTILLLYVLLPILHIQSPSIPTDIWVAWGALLGITSWHNGVADRLHAGDSGTLGSAVGEVIGKVVGGKTDGRR